MHEHHSTCEQCFFYRGVPSERQGECRRYAPSTHATGLGSVATVKWPHVRAIDWCGDFEPAPEAGEER